MATDRQSRLKSVLKAYGADPARWPDADRSDLADLLAAQTGSPSNFTEAEQVDRILAAASQPQPPAGATSRLADLARNTPQDVPSISGTGPVQLFGVGGLASGAILAASLIFGVYMGTLDSIDPFLSVDEEEVSLLEDPFGFESLEADGGGGSG